MKRENARPPLTSSSLPPAALVAHGAFVRRLAFHLVRDDAEADDATQETWVRAIERPPVEGPGVRTWLAAVLRNVVRMGRRSTTRREGRERASARSGAAAGADEAAARQEILDRVVAALTTLDPTHHRVILLRHYEGLPPREIAERLGVPVATVKSRLARAHERLRRHLDEGRGGNVEGWRGALGALAGLDLSKPFAVTGEGAATVGTASKVGIGVLGVALLGGGAWWLARGGTESGTSTAVRPSESPSAASAVLAPRPAPSELPTTAPSEAVPTSAAHDPREDEPAAELLRDLATQAAPGRIEGIVLRGREPVGGGRVSIRREPSSQVLDAGYSPSEPLASEPIGRDGAFAVGDAGAGTSRVLEIAPEGGPAIFVSFEPWSPPPSRRLVVTLGTSTVKGRVFDERGRPASGIVVLVGPSPKRPPEVTRFWAKTLTDREGGYEIGGLPRGPYVVSAYMTADLRGGRRDVETEGPGTGTTIVDLGADRAEPLWSGVVRSPDGRPVAGPSTMWLTPEGASPYIGVEVPFDAEGRFSRRLPPGTYDVHVNVTGRTLPRTIQPPSRVTIRDDLVSDVTVPGARLRGSVRDVTTGVPFFRRDQKLSLIPEGRGSESALGLHLAEDGTFSTVGIPPGRYAVSGRPTALVDSSGRPVAVEVREGASDVEVELWTER